MFSDSILCSVNLMIFYTNRRMDFRFKFKCPPNLNTSEKNYRQKLSLIPDTEVEVQEKNEREEIDLLRRCPRLQRKTPDI